MSFHGTKRTQSVRRNVPTQSVGTRTLCFFVFVSFSFVLVTTLCVVTSSLTLCVTVERRTISLQEKSSFSYVSRHQWTQSVRRNVPTRSVGTRTRMGHETSPNKKCLLYFLSRYHALRHGGTTDYIAAKKNFSLPRFAW